MLFGTELDFPNITPQTGISGVIKESHNNLTVSQNHILLTLKLYVYLSRWGGFLNFDNLLIEITKVEKIDKDFASVSNEKTIQFNKKWQVTDLKSVE